MAYISEKVDDRDGRTDPFVRIAGYEGGLVRGGADRALPYVTATLYQRETQFVLRDRPDPNNGFRLVMRLKKGRKM